MQPQEYQDFTTQLRANLSQDESVIGLVALGSMAQQDYQPDQWSDHDFFLIVTTGEQESFRSKLDWLPQPNEIAFSFRETQHGLKVVYQSGHLLEFAVFDTQELYLAKVNRYRVLLDRAEIEQQLVKIKAASTETPSAATDESSQTDRDFGQFLTNLLVGVGRYRRGEKLSGQQFVKTYAFRHLLVLLQKYLPSPQKSVLDNLDPYRRFERVYPALGEELNRLLNAEVPEAAQGLLAIAIRELKDYLLNYPQAMIVVLQKQLDLPN